MKIMQAIALASAAILAAGCAHDEHRAHYDESVTPSASQSGQNNQDNNNQYTTYQNENAARAGSESDNALVAQLRQSLKQDPQIAPLLPNIQIRANNGTVILSGPVQSDEQKRQIESIVLDASGIVLLDNQLRVSGPMNPTSNNTNSAPRIYHDAAGSMNAATNNALSPTSRTNGENQIYQQNQNQNPEGLNTNGNSKIP